MSKLLTWEKNWLRTCGWSEQQIQAAVNHYPDVPAAYLCHQAPFLDFTLQVNKHTLIPRLETEQLFQLAQQDLITLAKKAQKKQIIAVDLGTGSGALAIAAGRLLKKHHLAGSILASDLSSQALAVAKTNTDLNRVTEYLLFAQSDLLTQLQTKLPTTAWLLLANLPYIPDEQIKDLPASVRNCEPQLALAGGADGFRLIDKLLKQIISIKIPPKKIYLEIDPSHAQFFQSSKPIIPAYQWQIINDFNQFQRFVVGELN